MFHNGPNINFLNFAILKLNYLHKLILVVTQALVEQFFFYNWNNQIFRDITFVFQVKPINALKQNCIG